MQKDEDEVEKGSSALSAHSSVLHTSLALEVHQRRLATRSVVELDQHVIDQFTHKFQEQWTDHDKLTLIKSQAVEAMYTGLKHFAVLAAFYSVSEAIKLTASKSKSEAWWRVHAWGLIVDGLLQGFGYQIATDREKQEPCWPGFEMSHRPAAPYALQTWNSSQHHQWLLPFRSPSSRSRRICHTKSQPTDTPRALLSVRRVHISHTDIHVLTLITTQKPTRAVRPIGTSSLWACVGLWSLAGHRRLEDRSATAYSGWAVRSISTP
jgi:hypothetical protein